MDFRKLQAFCKVFEHRNFSKAGQELFLSQPTISAHVQGLEEELGLSLFDRLGRSVIPTPAAEVLYRAGVDVFRRLEQARSEIDLLQEKMIGEINIGASTIPAHWVLPRLLAHFGKAHPEVTFSLTVHSTATIIDQVAAGHLEVGMVGALPSRRDLVVQSILSDEVVAVATPEMASKLEYKALVRWPWILRERGSGTRKAFEDALEAAGISVARTRSVVQIESTQGVLAFARAGLGVGVLSRLAAGPDIASGTLTILDLGIPPITRDLHLIHLEGRSLLPATSAFLEHAREHVEELVSG